MVDDIFCGGCGHRLPAQAVRPVLTSSTPSPAKALAANGAEGTAPASARKYVTVLFADISGFTAMSEKLDPEDVTDLMNGCLSRMADVVMKYEGYVDKFVGDCIMALFGAPIAHENDPELAVRAALEMREVTRDYNKQLPVKLEKPLTLHIGINSGMVIAGGVGSDDNMAYTAMGDTVNLASRMESIAGGGQIFISKFTHNLVRNKFDFKEHEPIKVKGKQDPVSVYEVEGIRTSRPVSDQPVKTPLIGRSEEMKSLHKRNDQVLTGEAQVVFLTSDAGIGKSRVQREIETYLRDKEVQILQGTCHSFSRSTSYYLFAELIKGIMDIDSTDLPDTMAEKLAANLPLVAGLPEHPLPDEAKEAIVFLGSILGLDLGSEYDIHIQQMDAQDVMMSIFRSLQWLLERLTVSKPLILILEDLHYADTISIDVLRFLFEKLDQMQILLLLLLRPEKGHPSEYLPIQAERNLGNRCTILTFSRLRPEESDQMTRGLLQREDVPESVLNMVRQRADGNPFYIEAIVRDLMDNRIIEVSDAHPVRVIKNLDEVAIPDTIQGMVVSQIDRLPVDLKDILQSAAVIGPVFKLELIKQVVIDAQLEDRLQRLASMDMIFESKSFPEIEYSFKNMLIQEAAYSCLLLKKQRELHALVAAALEKTYQDRLDDYFEQLAHHYQQAQKTEKAYTYTVKSALKSKKIFANPNAVEHFQTALELRDSVENPDPPLSDVYIWISEVYELTGDLEEAIDARKQAVEHLADELQRADSQRHVGRIQEKQGKKEEALETYQAVHTILDQHPDSLEMARLLMNESWVLNRMRQTDEAIDTCQRALALFETHQAMEDIAQAHNNLAVFYESRQEMDLALQHNLKSMGLFTSLNNKRKLANVFLSLGYVYDKRNERDTALDYFESAIVTMEKIGNRYGAGTSLMAKGRCYMDMDRLDEAESVLIRALKNHRELNLNLKITANEIALAKVYTGTDNYQTARTHLSKARTIAEADDNRSDLGKVTHQEALLLAREGVDPRSKFEEAITLFETLGRQRDVVRVRSDMDKHMAATG